VEGLEEIAEVSVLNANYIAKKLAKIRGFNLIFRLMRKFLENMNASSALNS